MLVEHKADKDQNYPQQNSGVRLTASECEDILSAICPVDSMQAVMDYPILNFLRGSVTTERMRHEVSAEHGAMAHWLHNTSKEKDCGDHINKANLGRQTQSQKLSPPNAANCGASQHSTGMGLDSANFQSFMTGSHAIVCPVQEAPELEVEKMVIKKEEPSPIQNQSQQAVTRLDNPLIIFGKKDISNYRRKKNVTFINMLSNIQADSQK